jgi:hypothetical protein
MKQTEYDPELLQLKDELDQEWVNLWHEEQKKQPTTKQLTIDCIPPENVTLQQSPHRSKKTP